MSAPERKQGGDDDDEATHQWWSAWRAAHGRTCRARTSLFATPTQVLNYTRDNATIGTNTSNNDSLIYWSLPQRSEVTEFAFSSASTRAVEAAASAATTDEEENTRMVDYFVKNWRNTDILHHDNNQRFTSTPTKLQPLNSSTPVQQTPSPYSSGGGIFHYMTITLWATLKVITPGRSSTRQSNVMLGDEVDDALRDWGDEAYDDNDDGAQQEADIGMDLQGTTNGSSSSRDNSLIRWDLPVLNVELTEACLDFLEQALVRQSQEKSLSVFPTIFARRRTADAPPQDDSHDMGPAVNCWKDWINDVCFSSKDSLSYSATTDILVRLSDLEGDFLLDCLSKTGSINLIPADLATGTPKQDLVVLAPHLDPVVEQGAANRNNAREMSSQVVASWWELNSAQASLERRRQQWSHQADNWAKRALQEKRKTREQNRGQKGGLTSFKIHKLLVTRLEESEGLLLNLEKSRQTLEQSWHQREVIQALETSTRALHALRHDAEQNIFEKLMEAHRDELDHVQHTNQSLSTLANMTAHENDETDLLHELEGLTLDDAAARRPSLHPSPQIESKNALDESVSSPKKLGLQGDRKLPNAEAPVNNLPGTSEKVLVPG